MNTCTLLRAERDALDGQNRTLLARNNALHADLTASRRHPRIVCLCGSTRFYQTFKEANFRETMAGKIVLSVGFSAHAAAQAHGPAVGVTAAEKVALDELHKRKIDLADEILVLNVGGYIGDSTRSEIAYAMGQGKPVWYWEGALADIGREWPKTRLVVKGPIEREALAALADVCTPSPVPTPEEWPTVEVFAALMRRKLSENRHKGSRAAWRSQGPWPLLRRLRQEMDELEEAMRNESTPEEVRREAADVGNFAMMVADCQQ